MILSPNNPLDKGIITFVDNYYFDTFIRELTLLANALLSINEENEKAKNIISNIEEWADQIYINKKEVLLLSVENNSSFTLSLIQWIGDVTKLLMTISSTYNCSSHNKEDIEKHALWLISTLTWIKRDKKTATFVQSSNITEVLFEVCVKAKQRDCIEVFDDVQKIILDWGFTSGRNHTGWAILEQSILASVTLSFKTDLLSQDYLKQQIKEKLTNEIISEEGLLKRTVEDLKKVNLHYSNSRYNTIENYLYSIQEKDEANSFINEIALILEEKVS